ncbi:MAG: alanyl-tRNA editing protein [Hyphomicrobiaceae bacterium]
MTELLFRTDAYLETTRARVARINERGGIVLDRTPFYATSGGQPGDAGSLAWATGGCAIATAVYDADKATVVHVPAEGATTPPVGSDVTVTLDWDRRHRHMRMHTALHLLCALVKFPVTGGQIGADESRLDFDIPEAGAIDKDAIEADLNRLVGENHPVSERWITDDELAANPGLVRTMSVKPPMGSGRVRLVAIGADGAVDLQPCGGTHVRTTGEIGRLAITKIEKKGKQNRRLRLALA